MMSFRTWGALPLALACFLPLAAKQLNEARHSSSDGTQVDRGGTTPVENASIDDEEEKPLRTLPEGRGGQEVIGQKLPDLEFDAWLNDDDDAAEMRKRRVTLYRWWTNACPYCEASLPAFEQLRTEYEEQGLVIVAVYHPKPPRSVDVDSVEREAARLGFHGPVAVDADWSELRRAYLDKVGRGATSVTLLVDDRGVIRFVHPGPVLFASGDPAHEQENADYKLLEEAVRVLLE